jgi:GNAT superfamily N-acetyltransferase
MELPWKLYRDDPNWIPPLRDNLQRLVGWKPHPFQSIAEVETFVARRGTEPCGRIAAILNHEHNRVHSEQRGFFGFFECVDDQRVADSLFDAVAAWFMERNITDLRGPANPSMNYECGLLIDGFDSPPTFMMTYNPPFYVKLVEGYGFRKAHDLLAYVGHIEQLPPLIDKYRGLFEQAKERSNVTIRYLDKRRFREDLETFLAMYNRACATMWGFVPLTQPELEMMARVMKYLLIPEMAVAADADGKTVGVVLALPDFNPIIKKIDGRLFPFGFLRLMWAKSRITTARVISIAVIPEYQRWGLGLVLMGSMIPKALEQGMKVGEFSWISEDNDLARMGLEKGGAKIYKTYRMYDLNTAGREVVRHSHPVTA